MGTNLSLPTDAPLQSSSRSSTGSASGAAAYASGSAEPPTFGRHCRQLYVPPSLTAATCCDDRPDPGVLMIRSTSSAGSGSGDERKKKTSKFATLRKRLTRARRFHSGRMHDHGRALRELTSTWTVRELHSLNDEYEATAALKELTALADAARPRANTAVDDLAALYQHKYCTDVDLVYLGTVFPAHRAILCIRCPFFRELLARHPEYGARVTVTVRTHGVDVGLFSALLRYLYTGDFGLDETRLHGLRKLLSSLAHEFGAPNSLEQDLRTLLDTGAYSDAVLVFAPAEASSSTSESAAGRDPSCSPDPAAIACGTAGGTLRTNDGGTLQSGGGSVAVMRRSRSELRCHKAILAARSAFFRSLVLRRARSGEELTERALNTPTYIVLDELVIPRRYARALLTAIYLDTVDLSCIMRSSVSLGTLSEVQAAMSGRAHLSATDEAMELYHIGRFLDFPALAHGCEDIIAEALTVENLSAVLQWSSKPHGSTWVHRQAIQFLREEFAHLAQPSQQAVLCELSRDYLIEAVSSDFLQASELDVLTAVVRWAEHRLVKRLEEREPNLLSHTAHSISRKGVKKRDLNDVELREILSDVLPYVRTDHVLPSDSDILTNAIKRGLVSVPPSHMIGSDAPAVGGRSSASAWVRTRNMAMFVKPRLFTPYYDEIKALIKEQAARGQDNSIVQLRVMHTCAIPDALYMLEDRTCPMQLHQQHQLVRHQRQQQQQQQQHYQQLPVRSASASSTVDIIAGAIPERDVVETMRQRESELSHSKLAQRAYALLSSDRSAITRQIQLRVVREFGLPDSSTEALQNAALAAAAGDHRRSGSLTTMCQQDLAMPSAGTGTCRLLPAGSGVGGSRHWQQMLVQSQPRHRCSQDPNAAGRESPLALAPLHYEVDPPPSASIDSPLLRSAMPDIAMASASIARLSVGSPAADEEVDLLEIDVQVPPPPPVSDLDLGDGANHMVPGNSMAGGSGVGPGTYTRRWS